MQHKKRLLISLGLAATSAVGCQHATIDFPGVLDLSADARQVEQDTTAFEEQVIIDDDRRGALMGIPLSRDGTREALGRGFANDRGWRLITIDEQANPSSNDWLFSSVRLKVSAERVKLTHTTASSPTAPRLTDAHPPSAPPALEAP